MTKSSTRRKFLSDTTRAAGVVALSATAARSSLAAANDNIQLAQIGCGAMGGSHVNFIVDSKLPVSFAYLCDIKPEKRAASASKIADANFQQHEPKLVDDYQRVLDDKNVDAVIIATPNHWHVPIAIRAMQAGKDVYIEKPASHAFNEGQTLIEAAHKYKRIVQHGTQMRSSPITIEADEVLKSGILGEIKITKAWNVQDRGFQESVPDSEPPADVNYDRWLGPAPKRPFNVNRFNRNWMFFRDYCSGDFGNDGVHDLDLAIWALGVTEHPVQITAHGNNVRPSGYREFPDNMTVAFKYADEKVLLYEDRMFTPYGLHGVDSGNAFYGTEGYMIFSRRGFFRTYLGKKEEKGPASGKSGRVGAPVPSHMHNFLSCIRSREQPTSPAEAAHHVCALIHLGNIACDAKAVLDFDPQSEKITNHPKLNALLTKEYRAPYGLSENV